MKMQQKAACTSLISQAISCRIVLSRTPYTRATLRTALRFSCSAAIYMTGAAEPALAVPIPKLIEWGLTVLTS